MRPADVTACIATRGNVDMTPILEQIDLAGIEDVIVWDNSVLADRGPHGRFTAMTAARHDVIYVQDDDALVPPGSIRRLIRAYVRGSIVVNMPPEFRPHYPDSAMVGFGAVFNRLAAMQTFAWFLGYHQMPIDDPLFLRESCRALTTLTPRILMNVPKADMPYASDPDRLWKQPDHVANRERMLTLARQVRDA